MSRAAIMRRTFSLVGPLRVTVRQEDDGSFVADPGGVGAYIVGRGSNVLEAVGDLAIQRELLQVRTDPPELVDTMYRIDPKANRRKLVLTGCPRRD